MRNTRQKQAVMQVMQQAANPLTVHEVLAEGQKRLPALGLATVYREISRLCAAGDLRSVAIPGDPPRYEMARHHHHHFKCTSCGKVYELEGCVDKLKKLLPEGFQMETHDLTLYGVCRECGHRSSTL